MAAGRGARQSCLCGDASMNTQGQGSESFRVGGGGAGRRREVPPLSHARLPPLSRRLVHPFLKTSDLVNKALL